MVDAHGKRVKNDASDRYMTVVQIERGNSRDEQQMKARRTARVLVQKLLCLVILRQCQVRGALLCCAAVVGLYGFMLADSTVTQKPTGKMHFSDILEFQSNATIGESYTSPT